jgi:hypothetical protein
MSIVHSRKLQEYKKKLYRYPNSNIYRYKVNKYTYYLQKGGNGDDDEFLDSFSAENNEQSDADLEKELTKKIENEEPSNNKDILSEDEYDYDAEITKKVEHDMLKENYENLQNIYTSSKKIVSNYIKSMKKILPKKQ